MIVKELPVPDRLLKTEALAKRLIIGHSKQSEIERDLAKRRAGHWGEIILGNYLQEFPEDKYYILYDLQLRIQGVYFQIDTLLLSSRYILIIEAKNISGTLTFDSNFEQLIRTQQDGTEETFEDPRIQAFRIQTLLKRFLFSNGIQIGPIEYLIFFSNVKTILKVAPGIQQDMGKICKAREFFLKINQLDTTYQKDIIDPTTIDKIAKLLLSKHTPLKINILDEYKLSQSDIRTGVCCPECMCLPMSYVKGKWICPLCQTHSKEAHLEALLDYYQLFKSTITNSEFKDFLHLPSSDIAQKVLRSLQLQKKGTTRNRIYSIERVFPCVQ
ncbi:MAG: hypothetical protein K0Q87_2946 [Neobacillus sp.]|nr:hypothetical protein [Neobacillus sp.]